MRKFRRKSCNAEDAELGAINFCCAEDAQICAYKKTCCVGNPIRETCPRGHSGGSRHGGVQGQAEEVVPKKILKMLKWLLDEMADKPEEKWGWKVFEGFYKQLMEMLRTIEISRDWTEGKKVGDSPLNQGKVRAKTVYVKRLRKCIFCDEEGRQADQWAFVTAKA